jgi:coenzyme F420-reducing hydrogenase delta subunit
MMAEALKSHDHVMVAVCCEDACRHRDGNKRCIKQIERLKDRLDSLGYDSGRLSYVRTGVTMVNVLKEAALKALAGGEIK